jgi:hypothetical protein
LKQTISLGGFWDQSGREERKVRGCLSVKDKSEKMRERL